MKIRTPVICLLSVFMALGAVSCSKKNLKKEGLKTDMSTDIAAAPALDIQGGGALGSEGNIRGEEFVAYETIRPVYFDFDGYGLPEELRKTLQNNAAILKTHKEWLVVVEGYCDSRGTTEYNLALGQKRAKEVRDYYTRLGVPESSIGAISYGKEKPSCEEETDACWANNRRADTKVKPKQERD
ncbi:MAG: OmpA family protein [Elusimicrobiota bacterium]|nr:OmpA family protein [Elusimicrobiota bacterium]